MKVLLSSTQGNGLFINVLLLILLWLPTLVVGQSSSSTDWYAECSVNMATIDSVTCSNTGNDDEHEAAAACSISGTYTTYAKIPKTVTLCLKIRESGVTRKQFPCTTVDLCNDIFDMDDNDCPVSYNGNEGTYYLDSYVDYSFTLYQTADLLQYHGHDFDIVVQAFDPTDDQVMESCTVTVSSGSSSNYSVTVSLVALCTLVVAAVVYYSKTKKRRVALLLHDEEISTTHSTNHNKNNNNNNNVEMIQSDFVAMEGISA